MMRKMFWGMTFSSVSLFILFLGVNVAATDTWKAPGPDPVFGRLDVVKACLLERYSIGVLECCGFKNNA